MKRMWFILNAYPLKSKFQVLLLFVAEVTRLIGFCRKYFRQDVVESRAILGFVLDHQGSAKYCAEGIVISFNFQKQVIKLFLRWKSSDFLVFNQVFILEEYKKISSVNVKAPVIIDAGANIGCTSVYLSVFYPDSKIIAIEPDRNNFQMMEKNLMMNKLIRVKPLMLAVWFTNGRVSLTKKFRDERNWSLQVSESGADIESRTLGDILAQEGIAKADILKMDIEGAEFMIFMKDKSLESVLQKIRAVAIELHGDDDCIEKRLLGLGFSIEKSRETMFAKTLSNEEW